MRVLLYDSLRQSELTSDDGEWVHSLIQCLDKAVDGNPEIIVVHVEAMPIWEREARVELCAALKRNSHTRQIPVLVILPATHRGLMEELARVGGGLCQGHWRGNLEFNSDPRDHRCIGPR